ncbi:methionyl-tRNA formyltransferase [Metamycoplasma sualvi]|uniref:methionyl-tRNA formyltransferase n=1 Tax=Metamycoplasma sualvi TaxID=2125 RepID=UPI0038739926
MKIILAGTPSFSLETFEKIIKSFDVVALIAQPDRKIGRKQILTPPPTIELARKHNIKTYQPEKISEIYQELATLEFDIFLTMAYGQIIPQNILSLAKLGSFNIHASLLPKYRGAAPIQYAIWKGETITGITLMEMVSKMDAGDIFFQKEIAILPNDNYDSLLIKLSTLASENIVEWLNLIKENKYTRVVQQENLVSFAPKIAKEDELLNLDSIENTINKINALSSQPGAYIIDQKTNKRIKIFKASKNSINTPITIQCTDGIIYAQEYQMESKKKVTIL